MSIAAEEKRLQETSGRKVDWKEWGPYLSERARGTVREDYSQDGSTLARLHPLLRILSR
jgi:hypothetical protein